MDQFGNYVDSSTGVVMTREKLEEQRKKRGECVTCGRKCFRKKLLFKMIPITTEDGLVVNGRCLNCNPLNRGCVPVTPAVSRTPTSQDVERFSIKQSSLAHRKGLMASDTSNRPESARSRDSTCPSGGPSSSIARSMEPKRVDELEHGQEENQSCPSPAQPDRSLRAKDFGLDANTIRATTCSKDDGDNENSQDAKDWVYVCTAGTLESMSKHSPGSHGYRQGSPLVEEHEQVIAAPMGETAVALAVPYSSFPPVLTGDLAVPAEKAIQEHTELRTKINELKTVQECAQFFDCNLRFQGTIRLLRQAQNQFIETHNTVDKQPAFEKREEWARLWAMALSRDEEWAWALNHCRKTALELLYKVCNLSIVDDPEEGIKLSDEVEGTFKLRRIDEILGHCLVMDRANSLYNMTIRNTGERGLGWYSKYSATQYKEAFDVPLNPRGPTINKRLWWLFQVPELHEDATIQRLMQVAVPERLRVGRK